MRGGTSLILAVLLSAVLGGRALAQGTDARAAAIKNDLVEIVYVPPTNAQLLPVYDRLKARHVLEELRRFLAPLRLPRKLTVKTLQCNESNAFYDPQEVALHLCYEYVAWLERLAPTGTAPLGVTRENALVGAFVDVVMHELGHAVIDLFQVPVFGREEDAADQLAGFIMLQFGPATARRLLTGAAYMFRERATAVPDSDFSDSHSTDLQRFYNYMCIAYGGEPAVFADLVRRDFLPKARAANCASEYEQVRFAVTKTIGPFIDPDLLAVVHGIEWLRADDGVVR